MKKVIVITAALLTGVIIGFFGVIVSVFSDGSLSERLLTIGAILGIYAVLGFVLGIISPEYSWKPGTVLGFPGALFLGIYTVKEFNFYYLVYIAALIVLPGLTSLAGSWLRKRKSAKQKQEKAVDIAEKDDNI